MAVANSDCAKTAIQAAEVAGVPVDKIQKLLNDVDALRGELPLLDAISKVSMKAKDDVANEVLKAKRIAYIDASARSNLLSQVAPLTEPKAVADKFSAMIVGSPFQKNSAAWNQRAIKNILDGKIIATLDRLKQVDSEIYKNFQTGKLDRHIMLAKEKLTRPDFYAQQKYATEELSPEAIELAKTQIEIETEVRSMAAAHGVIIKDAPDFIMSASHNPAKIANAAQDMSGLKGFFRRMGRVSAREVDRAAYVADVEKYVDLEATHKRMTEAGRTNADVTPDFKRMANNLYEVHVTGMRVDADGRPKSKATNYLEQLESGQLIVFKNAEAQLDYLRKYGDGTIAQAYDRFTGNISANLALIRQFGASGLNNIKGAYAQKMVQARKALSESKGRLFTETEENTGLVQIERFYNSLGNLNQEAAPPMVESWVNAALSYTRMRLLGNTTKLSFLTDHVQRMSQMTMNGKPLWQAFFDSSLWRRTFEVLKDPKLRRHIRAFNQGTDGLLGAYQQRWDDIRDSSAPDDLFKMLEQGFFNFSGITGLNRINKMSHFWDNMSWYGVHQDVEWDALEPLLRDDMFRSGISKLDWDFARGSLIASVERPDKPTALFLDPSIIRNVSDEYIRGWIKSNGIKKSVAEFRYDQEIKWNSILSYNVDQGVLSADAQTKALVYSQLNPYMRLFMRMGLQLKSFPIAFHQKQLGAMMKTTGMKGIAVTFGMLTLYGILDIISTRLLAGQKPIGDGTPEDYVKLVSAGAVKGGGLGFISDFWLGTDWEKGGTGQGQWWSIIPVLAPIATGGNLTYKIGSQLLEQGEVEPEVKDRTINYFKSLIPQTFFTRPLLDRLVVWGLSEMISPGYLERMEERFQKRGTPMFDSVGSGWNSYVDFK